MKIGKPNIEKMTANGDVEGLIKALRHKDDDVRGEAAMALGEIKDERAVEPLIQALKDEAWFVRDNAADALGEIGDTAAVPTLSLALTDEREGERVRWTAAMALGKIGEAAVPALVEALKDDKWEVRHDASQILANEYRNYFSVNLAKIASKTAVTTLIKALKDVQWSVRYNAAIILGEIGDERAVKPLEARLNDKDESVRTVAKEALKKIKRKKN